MEKHKKTRHSTYFTNYHIVWIPKYRRKILTGSVATAVEESLRTVAQVKGWEIIALEVMPDHVHLFVSALEVTESYTSKASFLDRDELPEYDPERTVSPVFSGRRVKRGLYRSTSGQTVNADLNGAANILRKAFPDADLNAIDRALLKNPIRLCPLTTVKKRHTKSKAAA